MDVIAVSLNFFFGDGVGGACDVIELPGDRLTKLDPAILGLDVVLTETGLGVVAAV